jgi:D-galactose 1-dehydrogenase
MAAVKVAIVGVGKIVRDQHVPALADNPAFDLAATASPHSTLDGVDNYTSLDDLLAARPDVEAVAVCTPPQVRHAIARKALRAGKHVLLEKPPGATVSEVETLRTLADAQGLSLFATWHSRHAPAVQDAKAWVDAHALSEVEIVWREDVRRWHPGQAWIWEPGGLGVFDPGVNALSIATLILPPFFLTAADLSFPANRQAPIAAKLEFRLEGADAMTADFDWRQEGPQTWDIRMEAKDGSRLRLSMGGAELEIDGAPVAQGPVREYGGIYDRFADLIAAKSHDVDVRPLAQVADAFLLGRRLEVEAFYDGLTS